MYSSQRSLQNCVLHFKTYTWENNVKLNNIVLHHLNFIKMQSPLSPTTPRNFDTFSTEQFVIQLRTFKCTNILNEFTKW